MGDDISGMEVHISEHVIFIKGAMKGAGIAAMYLHKPLPHAGCPMRTAAVW